MTTIGALIGLMLSVFLIIKKIAPAYSLIAGAIVGGLLGGLPLVETVKMMTEGVKDVTPAIIRILTAGVLSGVLIKTGAAATLSNAIISSLGEKRVFGFSYHVTLCSRCIYRCRCYNGCSCSSFHR